MKHYNPVKLDPHVRNLKLKVVCGTNRNSDFIFIVTLSQAGGTGHDLLLCVGDQINTCLVAIPAKCPVVRYQPSTLSQLILW